jgi:hypothetical protein
MIAVAVRIHAQWDFATYAASMGYGGAKRQSKREIFARSPQSTRTGRAGFRGIRGTNSPTRRRGQVEPMFRPEMSESQSGWSF